MKHRVMNIVKAAVKRMWNYLRWLCASEIYCCDGQAAFEELSRLAPSPGTSALTDNHIGSPEYDLTVIIPAYNAEKWLNECMDSVLKQETAFTYQVVAVNDGSTDRTGAILDSYANNGNLLVIHQENRGYSGARNAAMKQHIRSKYVMFVDSDDILLPGAVEKLLSQAMARNADIVEGNGYRFDDSGRLGLVKPGAMQQSLWGGPCLKVIRSELLERLSFPVGYLYEDTIISTLLAPLAQTIVLIPDEVYGYRIHGASITQKHTAELNRVHSFWIMLQVHEDMKQLGLEKNYESYCRTMRHIVFTYRRCILLPENVKRLIFICTRTFLTEHYSKYLSGKDAHSKLAAALIQYQYGKYCVLCETNNG